MKALRRIVSGLCLATPLLSPLVAAAQPVLAQRCSVDNLDTAQAIARLQWARMCALGLHVASPSKGYTFGMVAADGLQQLVDYKEDRLELNPTGRNLYTSQLYEMEVNSAFVTNLYLSAATSQTTDAYGFKAWSRPANRQKARPLYPTFGTQSDIFSGNNRQLFPHPTLGNCALYYDQAATQPASPFGEAFYINGYCESSCYAPEQEVLFSAGYVPIARALAQRREDLVTLGPESTLDSLQWEQGRTFSYTAEFRDSAHPLVEVRTGSGGQLRVTTEHPVITSDGRLRQAQSLTVGDELVRPDGSRDTIVSVDRTIHFGKVYNLRPTSSAPVANVLVAQGYLVGSSLFQNDEVGYTNRILLYSAALPDELLP